MIYDRISNRNTVRIRSVYNANTTVNHRPGLQQKTAQIRPFTTPIDSVYGAVYDAVLTDLGSVVTIYVALRMSLNWSSCAEFDFGANSD